MSAAAQLQTAQQLHLQRFCPENVQHNAKQLYYIRSVATSVAGSAAGILGLVNLTGFYFFALSVLATNVVILCTTLRLQPRRYLLSFNRQPAAIATLEKDKQKKVAVSPLGEALPFAGLLIDGLQDMAFGYVLWWTLWTALIHIFD